MPVQALACTWWGHTTSGSELDQKGQEEKQSQPLWGFLLAAEALALQGWYTELHSLAVFFRRLQQGLPMMVA